MKTFMVVFAMFLTAACGQGNGQTTRTEPAKASPTPVSAVVKTETESECRICKFDFSIYKGELNEKEVGGLLLALNDEYMALAIYEQINRDFKDPRPFVNIVQAEARHADRLKDIFKTYNVPVPENTWPGNVLKFDSVAAACKAGVDAEIANRDLYTKLFATTAREDILIVYKALQRASDENHLPAFERCGGGGRGPGNGRGPGGRGLVP
jgi:hypothetical protein